jgi:hypothetical protein
MMDKSPSRGRPHKLPAHTVKDLVASAASPPRTLSISPQGAAHHTAFSGNVNTSPPLFLLLPPLQTFDQRNGARILSATRDRMEDARQAGSALRHARASRTPAPLATACCTRWQCHLALRLGYRLTLRCDAHRFVWIAHAQSYTPCLTLLGTILLAGCASADTPWVELKGATFRGGDCCNRRVARTRPHVPRCDDDHGCCSC